MLPLTLSHEKFMKRVAFLAVAIVSSLAACSDKTPFAPEALEAPSARVVVNERVTFPANLFNPCTNELVVGEVTIHTVIGQQENKDGSISLKFHQNFIYQGETATGVKYVANQAFNEQVEFSSAGGFEDRFVGHFIANRQGSETPADDFHVFVNVDVSFDPATGTVTVKRDTFRTECR